MFNKKPRKNFRQRKKSSSDDEDKETNSGEENGNKKAPVAIKNKPLKAAQGRGISCYSKREATPPQPDSSDGEDWGKTLEVTEERREKENYGTRKTKTSVLSFSDDKEESTFELKRSSDKAVLFQVRKKEIPSAQTSRASSGVGDPSSSPPKHVTEASPHSPDDDDDDNNSNNADSDDDDASSQSA
ncbi:histone-lysine N-methyltransferase SETD1B, partial [Austrofundulus limnaeus]|uniref:Histone-lysine N-methyltransferase SETD1B n=1 Tax=Austrofundulus limnaeus TaxID=52670 RepID=A0A2I4AML6_AUSLI